MQEAKDLVTMKGLLWSPSLTQSVLSTLMIWNQLYSPTLIYVHQKLMQFRLSPYDALSRIITQLEKKASAAKSKTCLYLH